MAQKINLSSRYEVHIFPYEETHSIQIKYASTQKCFTLDYYRIFEMIKLRSLCCGFWVVILLLGFSGKGIADSDWSMTLYGAVLLKGNLSDASVLNSGFEDSYLVALALAKKVASYKEKIDLELEGQTVKHFNDQDHWEFNGLAAIRWISLPWDKCKRQLNPTGWPSEQRPWPYGRTVVSLSR